MCLEIKKYYQESIKNWFKIWAFTLQYITIFIENASVFCKRIANALRKYIKKKMKKIIETIAMSLSFA